MIASARAGIPALVPDQEAQLANAKVGGIPVSAATYRDPIAQERRYRWMKPLGEALPHAVNIYQFPEASEVISILELGLNQAVAGNTNSAQALNGMAEQIQRGCQAQLQHRQTARAALRPMMKPTASAARKSERWSPSHQRPRASRPRPTFSAASTSGCGAG